jgi:hypothetical protein
MLKAVEGEDGKPTSKWLRVPGLGDSIVAAHSGAKAVAVSLKERASILPLGHAGTPIWYDPRATKWTTLGAEPAWLAAWNVSHPVVAREREIWTPIDAVQLAALAGVPDDRPGELGIHGFGAAFPHDPAATGKHIHEALFAMPLGNEVVLETAIGAVEGSGLGTDQTPDLLVVSLSAHDYIGHGWGHESWEMWDSELRLDQQLAHFLDDLDRTVGAGRWAMIVTSDHGASPLPETIGGGRMTHAQIQTAANNAAAAVLGPGQWIDNAHYPNVFFSKAMLAQPKGELDSATKRVIFALRSFPGIERVDRVSSFAGNCDKRTGTAHTLCETFDPERSGDLFYLPAKGWIMMDEDEPAATAHGSMQDYDQLVPLIIIEPGAHKHLPETSPGTEIEMTGVSTMLAHWLGVTPPLALAR